MERQVASKPLPHILTGAERIRELAHMRTVIGMRLADDSLAPIARRDPSLLLEDSERKHSYLAGSLLDEAVYFDRVKTVSVALEAGVHPDDRTAFQRTLPGGGQVGGLRLIAERTSTTEQRLPSKEMLELALKHGADPDGDVEAFEAGREQSPLRSYAMEVSEYEPMASMKLPATLACIRLLLNANTKCIDPNGAGAKKGWCGFLTLLGSATVLNSLPSISSPLAKEFRSLAELALEKGASLNYVIPDDGLPQALWLARAGWSTMSAILVELGAADSWELPPGMDPESFLSGEGLALYRESALRRRLQAEAAREPDAAGQAPAGARRGARL